MIGWQVCLIGYKLGFDWLNLEHARIQLVEKQAGDCLQIINVLQAGRWLVDKILL